ncbi:MAG: NAD+ synthase [Acidobacteriia bacterium]|nr:NAD+ synthase [Terriglobia bacterium]
MDLTSEQIGALPELNAKLVVEITTRFLSDELRKAGFQKAVLGLSGGIDSSVVAALAVRALGANNVIGVMMPYRTSSPQSTEDAVLLAAQIGLSTEKFDISEMADGYLAKRSNLNDTRRGNVFTRCRMIVLYDFSAERNALVLGTSNKTELLLGYGTLFGDLASALNPIGDLYKTEIRQLARFLDIPERIISKPPTADLWAGQSDETELGFSYDEVDRLLYHCVDLRFSGAQLVASGFSESLVTRVVERIRRNQFKRRGPLVCKLSPRSVTHDFLYPRDWGT